MQNFVNIYIDVNKFYDDPMSIQIYIFYISFNIFSNEGSIVFYQ